MGLLTRIRNVFAQLGAEAGVAKPTATPLVADVVEVHRTDLPQELPIQAPLAPELPEPSRLAQDNP